MVGFAASSRNLRDDVTLLQQITGQLVRVILTATPKSQDNHVEAIFQQSTVCEW